MWFIDCTQRFTSCYFASRVLRGRLVAEQDQRRLRVAAHLLTKHCIYILIYIYCGFRWVWALAIVLPTVVDWLTGNILELVIADQLPKRRLERHGVPITGNLHTRVPKISGRYTTRQYSRGQLLTRYCLLSAERCLQLSAILTPCLHPPGGPP